MTRPAQNPTERTVRVVEHPRRGMAARSAKSLAQAAATLLLLPRWLLYSINRRISGREEAFVAASEGLARIPGRRGLYMRQAFYRRTLASCGRDVYFGWLTVFTKAAARVGDRAYFGRGCGVGWVDIGEGVMLADGVQVLSGARQHGRSSSAKGSHQDEAQEYRRVEIGAGAWVGTNAIVMADVGERTVVGAGAVVVEPLPADGTAVGVPARLLRNR